MTLHMSLHQKLNDNSTDTHKHKLHTHHKYILSLHICMHAQYTHIHTHVHIQVHRQPLRHINGHEHIQFPVTYNCLTKVEGSVA